MTKPDRVIITLFVSLGRNYSVWVAGVCSALYSGLWVSNYFSLRVAGFQNHVTALIVTILLLLNAVPT